MSGTSGLYVGHLPVGGHDLGVKDTFENTPCSYILSQVAGGDDIWECLVTGLGPKGSREKGKHWLGDQLVYWDGYF